MCVCVCVCVCVQAWSSVGDSDWSVPATFTTGNAPPAPPSHLDLVSHLCGHEICSCDTATVLIGTWQGGLKIDTVNPFTIISATSYSTMFSICLMVVAAMMSALLT